MLTIRKQLFFSLGILLFIFTFSDGLLAQKFSFDYQYELDYLIADEPPEFIAALNIEHPEEAMKSGVEGRLRASFVIAEDGSTKDIVIAKGLPHGVDEAVEAGIRDLRFKPAKRNGKPVKAKMFWIT